ncbi:MAG: ABC transporter permease [Chloroflexi bacterium]|nr:ABC transporter permease [Chloroflexota bacterium]
MRRIRFALAFYTYAVIGLLIYLPIVILIVFSFNDSRVLSLPWKGFTLRWYAAALQRPDLHKAIWTSLWIAAVVTVISLVLGVLAANAMARYRYRGRLLFTGYVALPFVVPWLLLGIALLLYFHRLGVPLSAWTIILSHVTFDVPLVAVLVAARMHQFDPWLEAAARDLGCTPWQAFRYVTLPIIAPAVIAAGIFAFNWSFDAFVVTHFVSGTQVTFPLWVWSALRYSKNLPVINAVSSVIVVVEMGLVLLAEVLRRRGGAGDSWL